MYPPNSNEFSSSPAMLKSFPAISFIDKGKVIPKWLLKEAKISAWPIKMHFELDKVRHVLGPQNHVGPHILEHRAGHCSSNHEDHQDLEKN